MTGGPVSRCHHTVTTFGNKLVLFGGIRDSKPSNDVCIFDTTSRSWIVPEVLGSPPIGRHGHSALLLNEERILILGGQGIPSHDAVWFLEVDTPYVRKQSQLLNTTVVAWSKGIFGNLPRPVVICGPSGVGKGTLINRLMKDFPSMFGFSVSHTTRQPRHLERNGVHYHFTERSWMESAIQEGKFLESADVHGNLYGTSIAAVESVANDGKRCILDIDVQGARAVKKSALDAAFIFIAPPSLEQLEGRLRGRGTENEEQIQKRLRNAKAELECGRDSSIFNHYLINDDLDECYSELQRLLGLDLVDANEVQGANSNQAWLDSIHGHSAALVGGNVFVIGGDIDPNVEPAMIIIDTSCIVGGAPGQTTRLRLVLHKHRSELPNGNHFVKTSKENGHL